MASAPRKRALLVVAVVGLLLGLAVLIALVSLSVLESYVRRRVVQEARAKGVILQVDELDFGLNHVSLTGASFELEQVSGVRGTLRRFDVTLSGFEPSAFGIDGADVRVTGSAATLAVELGSWTRRHPDNFRLPLSANDVRISWSAPPGTPPWLVIEGGSMVPNPQGGRFTAKRTRFEGVEAGALNVAWTADQASVGVGFGASDPAAAPLRLEVRHAAQPPTIAVTLAPMPLDDLSGPFGMKLPVDNVTVSGQANVALIPRGESDAYQGNVRLVLDGFVPPHPRELDGFIFGNRTTVSTDFTVREDRQHVALTNVDVTAGSFGLKGQGEIQRQTDHALFSLDLRGQLSCAALASANAESYLGKMLAPFARRAAADWLKGSVSVLVRIQADSRDLANAKLLRTIGIGCGLKPLPLPDLGDFADWVGQALPPLPSGLPALPGLPSALPPLPQLPSALPPLPSGLPTFPNLTPPPRPPAKSKLEPGAARDAGAP